MPLPPFERLDPTQRRAILEKAGDAFANEGFAGASYNRLIREMGLSKGAMYYYFEGKDDLFRTAVEDAVESVISTVGSPGEVAVPEDFWSEIEAMYLRLLGCFRDHPSRSRLFWRVVRSGGSHSAHGALAEGNQRVMAWVQGMIVLGQRVGALRRDRPEALLAYVAFSMVDGMARWMMAEGGVSVGPDIEEAVVLIDFLRRAGSPGDGISLGS